MGHGQTAILHMLCGKVASGKSTLTARLLAVPQTILISEDKWLSCLYPDEIHTLADYVSRVTRMRTVLTEHVRALLTMGISVVLDFPFNTVSTRLWGKSLLDDVGCAHQLHYLDVSDETCKARLAARNASGEHPFQTSEEQYDQITRYFVAPTPGEGLNIIVYDETGTALTQVQT